MSCTSALTPVRLFNVYLADSGGRHFLGFCSKEFVCVVILCKS